MSTLVAATVSTDNITDTSTGNNVDAENVYFGTAKVWGNAQQTSTQTLNESFNITSLTDGGTGSTTWNFTNNMSSGTYSAGSATDNSTGGSQTTIGSDSTVVGSFRSFRRVTTTATDGAEIMCQVDGELA
jgi:hypothetical protein